MFIDLGIPLITFLLFDIKPKEDNTHKNEAQQIKRTLTNIQYQRN